MTEPLISKEFYLVQYEKGHCEAAREAETILHIVENNKQYSHLKNARIYKVVATEEYKVFPSRLEVVKQEE